MKHFIDCEFIERGFMEPIDLISIGVVSEDGREYYAVSAEFDGSRANDWVKANVLPYLCRERKTLYVIAAELRDFIGNDPAPEFWGWCCGYDYVLVSQLIGFNDWPSNWPYYFRDIQQEADRLGIRLTGEQRDDTHNALADAREIRGLAATLGIVERVTA